jgi:hypothetical protein
MSLDNSLELVLKSQSHSITPLPSILYQLLPSCRFLSHADHLPQTDGQSFK